MEKASRSSFIDSAAVQGRSVAVLLLIVIAAVFVLPGSAARLAMIKETLMKSVSGEDIVELGRREIEKASRQGATGEAWSRR